MTDKDTIKRVVAGAFILSIFVLALIIIRPIIISIILGLLFAYIFSPVFKLIRRGIKNKSLSAFILMAFLTILIAIPAIFLTPILVEQAFETFNVMQDIDFGEIMGNLVGGDLADFFSVNIDNIISKTFSSFLNQFTDLLVNLPSFLLQFAVFLFTFFFVVRDSEQLKHYVSTLSPFSERTEKRFMREFRGITNSIVYGQVLIGIIQGLATGAGLFFIGVDNVLMLTFIASIASMIPFLGSWLVWLPAGILLLVTGDTFSGIFLLLYGALFVATIDNLIRPFLMSKQSSLPIVLSVIGIIGGLYVFGIAGLVLGPLILAYILIIIELYREGKLNELFKGK